MTLSKMPGTMMSGGTQAVELLVCNCEATMTVDGSSLARGLGSEQPLRVHSQLCRRQLAAFEAALDGAAPIAVACTQEAPLFRELAQGKLRDDITFVNIRERAGWCAATPAQSTNVQAKMAALLADAMHEAQPTGSMSLNSDGQCLVYGSGQQVLDAASRLGERLSVTVVFVDAGDVIAPSTVTVPMHIGHIRQLSGALGDFSVSLDGFAAALPHSRAMLAFEAPRNGVSTTCDLILDLSRGPSLVPGGADRDGYFKVDPGSPAAVAEAVFEICDLVGEFEKPLYVDFDGEICAHSRSQNIGCRNCLDHCPTGAISPAGDVVSVEAIICGGCGSCSAVCPTGAVSYAYPRRDDVIDRIGLLARTYQGAGGRQPVLLLHDDKHGGEAIGLMARFGKGLPGNVIPLALYSVFQVGHDLLAAALATGFCRVVVMAPPDKPHEMPALTGQIGLANALAAGLGFGDRRVMAIEEADPDRIEARLHGLDDVADINAKPFVAAGGKRQVARLALAALHDVALQPQAIIALPAGAPYGRLVVDVDNCTLCLACVGACPAGALSDDQDRPRLTFNEGACVQCGLCVATCPERVITLEPRYNFSANVIEPVLIKEEEPFACISCGKPFGTKSTVEAIVAKLEGRHAMFQNPGQIELIKMCDDCRVVAVNDAGGDPLRMGERPRVRTTDDYLIGNVDEDET